MTQDRRARRPVLGALPRGRRRARRPVHLPARAGRGFLTVTNAANHEQRPGLVPRARRGASTARWWTPHADWAMLAVQGPDARAALRGAGRGRRCPRGCARADGGSRGAGVPGLRHRLHRRGRRRAARAARATRRRSGTRSLAQGVAPGRARRARHAAPRGLLPPLRQRPLRGPQSDRGRPRLVLQARHGLHRRRRAARRSSPTRRSSPFAFTGPGIPRAGQPRAHRGRATAWSPAVRCRPAWTTGSAWRTCPRGGRSPGTAIEVDVRGKPRARRGRARSRCTGRPRRTAANRSEVGRDLPRRPEVPPRARLGADRGRRGHLRHHLVRPGRARRGRVLRPARGRHADDQGPGLRRGRVGEGGLGRVRAAVGRDRGGERGARRHARSRSTHDPYGEGWLVRVKLSDPCEVDSLLDVGAYKDLLQS